MDNFVYWHHMLILGKYRMFTYLVNIPYIELLSELKDFK